VGYSRVPPRDLFGALNGRQLLPAIALLCVLWIGLPVRLLRPSNAPTTADCLTLSDTKPVGRPGIVAALERCAAILPKDTEVMADLGAEYETAGSPELAEAVYQRALAIDPGYADLRLRLGRLMLQRGAAGEAHRQANAALRMQPNRKALLDLRNDATRAQSQP
jgi:tetratricopeptide (TPR) repeat protein